MKFLIGLGNPGQKYEKTLHNVGFLLLDLIAQEAGVRWQASKPFQAMMGEGTFAGHRVVLVKPQTFMNRSGSSVAAVCRYYRVAAADLFVVHDDIDVAWGKVKLRAAVASGHGGHNGIRDILQHWGESAFNRIKVGVGRPGNVHMDVVDWVLSELTTEQTSQLEELVFPEVKMRFLQAIQQAAKST